MLAIWKKTLENGIDAEFGPSVSGIKKMVNAEKKTWSLFRLTFLALLWRL